MGIAALQELMGHKKKETTLKYIHLAKTNLRQEMSEDGVISPSIDRRTLHFFPFPLAVATREYKRLCPRTSQFPAHISENITLPKPTLWLLSAFGDSGSLRHHGPKLVRASFTSVGNEAGSLWVYPLDEPPWWAETGCQLPTFTNESFHICGITPVPRVGLTPHQRKQCADAVCHGPLRAGGSHLENPGQLGDCRAHLAFTGKPAETWRSLEVFHAQVHGRVGPRGVELLFDKRRFALALLRRQGLPQAEEQPAVAGVFVHRRTEDRFRLLRLPVAQQRGGQRRPYRVEPRWRLIVLERRLQLDRTAPLLNGLPLFPHAPTRAGRRAWRRPGPACPRPCY